MTLLDCARQPRQWGEPSDAERIGRILMQPGLLQIMAEQAQRARRRKRQARYRRGREGVRPRMRSKR